MYNQVFKLKGVPHPQTRGISICVYFYLLDPCWQTFELVNCNVSYSCHDLTTSQEIYIHLHYEGLKLSVTLTATFPVRLTLTMQPPQLLQYEAHSQLRQFNLVQTFYVLWYFCSQTNLLLCQCSSFLICISPAIPLLRPTSSFASAPQSRPSASPAIHVQRHTLKCQCISIMTCSNWGLQVCSSTAEVNTYPISHQSLFHGRYRSCRTLLQFIKKGLHANCSVFRLRRVHPPWQRYYKLG